MSCSASATASPPMPSVVRLVRFFRGVKRAVKFDQSEQVAQKCAWFYEQYVQPGTYDFVSSGMAVAGH